MRLEYKTYAEASKYFNWSERWEVFEKSRESLNIAYECVDRHPRGNTAIRLKLSDGSRQTYSFAQIADLSSQFANMLERRDIKAGDRVAIALNPSLEFYVSFYGILKRGAVAVPCYSLLGSEGLKYRLEDSGAKMLIIGGERTGVVPSDMAIHVVVAEDLRDLLGKESPDYVTSTSADSLAVIQYSSGTTGLPQQVPYYHGTVSVSAVYTKFWLGLRDGDSYMCTSSPAWGHGIWYGTVGPLIFGNGIGAYSGKFEPEVFIQGLEEFEITVMSAIPRVYQLMMNCGKLDKHNIKLRRMTYTGAAIDRKCQEYFLKTLGHMPNSVYGNTEVGPIVVDYAFEDYRPKIGTAGKPMLGTRVVALDADGNELAPGQPGELSVWRKGSWQSVGDCGYVDEEGYVTSLGRSDDVIKSSGYRIGPSEIEYVLDTHPAVRESAVVGSPDVERGEIVKAFIVPKVPPSPELTREIQDFVKSRLSLHEYPREVEYVDELPKTPDGKLQRKTLKQMERARKEVAV